MRTFWIVWLWGVMAFCQPNTTGQIGKAIQLRDRMAKEMTAQDVRDYTIMLVDQHVKQVLWRSFFLKNLGEKETVLEARAKAESEDPRRIVLIEDNLEELLLAADKEFPDDFDVMFAKAYFLYRGRCCLIKPLISMTDSDMIKIFEKADQLGKGCAQSTFALVKTALDSGDKLGDADLALLNKAHSLDVSDPEIASVLLDQLLLAAKYPEAVQVAKSMYASQDFLQQKLIALHGSARAFYAMGRYNDVMKAVNQGLKLAPSHGYLWSIGMDTARATDNKESYVNLTVNYLDKAAFSMSALENYFVYLANRGNHAFDIEAAKYCETLIRSENPINVDQLVGIATLWLRLNQADEARANFVKAREILMNDEEANAELVALVDQGIQACDRPVK